MEHRRWIVVGTDFSPAARRALEHAAKLATEVGATVACVHAYEGSGGAPLDSEPPAAVLSQLQQAVAHLRARFPDIRVESFVRRGAPWDKLANVACELGAEIIVVGACGESERAEACFLGRVAERLAASTTRSVLIVSPRDSNRGTWTERSG